MSPLILFSLLKWTEDRRRETEVASSPLIVFLNPTCIKADKHN